MQFIMIQIPVIDTGDSVEDKFEKMHEEIDELFTEFNVKGPIDLRAAMAEMFDVIQVMHGYIQAANPEDVAGRFMLANIQHVKKMRRYAAERGWNV